MRKRVRGIRPFAGVLAAIYFGTQCAFVHASESGFWSERRRCAQNKSSHPLMLARVPTNPGVASSPLAQRIPAVQRQPLSSSPFRADADNIPPDFAKQFAALLNAIPPACGAVRKISLPKGGRAPSRIVFHIQDVHGNAEAQQHIARAVKTLLEDSSHPRGFSIGSVALEGAFGPIPLEPFHAHGAPAIVNKVADYLLRENKISGPVHAGLACARNAPPFVGIDDRAHYDANVRAYLQSVPKAENVKQRLTQARQTLVAQKGAVLNPRLLAFHDRLEQYRDEKESLTDHVRSLAEIPGLFPGPQTKLFRSALSLESSLDFREVERQRTRLVETLSASLRKEDLDTLLRQSVAYRLGQIRYAEYFARLVSLCRSAGVSLARFPAMDEYIRYVLLSDGIHAETLLDELADQEKKALALLAKTPEELRWVHNARVLWLTEKLTDFSLTPSEWGEYQALQPPEGVSLASFENFYREAQSRDTAMARNLLRERGSGGERERNSNPVSHSPPLSLSPSVLILITGGFHSPGLTEELNRQGAAVITFAPKIDKVTIAGAPAYLSVFAQEKTPLDKLFQGEKLFLSPHPAPPEALAEGAAINRVLDMTEAADELLEAYAPEKASRVEAFVTDATDGKKVLTLKYFHQDKPKTPRDEVPPPPLRGRVGEGGGETLVQKIEVVVESNANDIRAVKIKEISGDVTRWTELNRIHYWVLSIFQPVVRAFQWGVKNNILALRFIPYFEAPILLLFRCLFGPAHKIMFLNLHQQGAWDAIGSRSFQRIAHRLFGLELFSHLLRNFPLLYTLTNEPLIKRATGWIGVGVAWVVGVFVGLWNWGRGAKGIQRWNDVKQFATKYVSEDSGWRAARAEDWINTLIAAGNVVLLVRDLFLVPIGLVPALMVPFAITTSWLTLLVVSHDATLKDDFGIPSDFFQGLKLGGIYILAQTAFPLIIFGLINLSPLTLLLTPLLIAVLHRTVSSFHVRLNSGSSQPAHDRINLPVPYEPEPRTYSPLPFQSTENTPWRRRIARVASRLLPGYVTSIVKAGPGRYQVTTHDYPDPFLESFLTSVFGRDYEREHRFLLVEVGNRSPREAGFIAQFLDPIYGFGWIPLVIKKRHSSRPQKPKDLLRRYRGIYYMAEHAKRKTTIPREEATALHLAEAGRMLAIIHQLVRARKWGEISPQAARWERTIKAALELVPWPRFAEELLALKEDLESEELKTLTLNPTPIAGDICFNNLIFDPDTGLFLNATDLFNPRMGSPLEDLFSLLCRSGSDKPGEQYVTRHLAEDLNHILRGYTEGMYFQTKTIESIPTAFKALSVLAVAEAFIAAKENNTQENIAALSNAIDLLREIHRAFSPTPATVNKKDSRRNPFPGVSHILNRTSLTQAWTFLARHLRKILLFLIVLLIPSLILSSGVLLPDFQSTVLKGLEGFGWGGLSATTLGLALISPDSQDPLDDIAKNLEAGGWASKKQLSVFERIRLIVSREKKPVTVAYPGAGVDMRSPLLATGGSRYFMTGDYIGLDPEEIRRVFKKTRFSGIEPMKRAEWESAFLGFSLDFGQELAIETALLNNAQKGFVASEEACRSDIQRYLLALECISLGVDPRKVSVTGKLGDVTLDFFIPGFGKVTYRFFNVFINGIENPTPDQYPQSLKEINHIDVTFTKASLEMVDILNRVLRFFVSKMDQGGHFVINNFSTTGIRRNLWDTGALLLFKYPISDPKLTDYANTYTVGTIQLTVPDNDLDTLTPKLARDLLDARFNEPFYWFFLDDYPISSLRVLFAHIRKGLEEGNKTDRAFLARALSNASLLTRIVGWLYSAAVQTGNSQLENLWTSLNALWLLPTPDTPIPLQDNPEIRGILALASLLEQMAMRGDEPSESAGSRSGGHLYFLNGRDHRERAWWVESLAMGGVGLGLWWGGAFTFPQILFAVHGLFVVAHVLEWAVFRVIRPIRGPPAMNMFWALVVATPGIVLSAIALAVPPVIVLCSVLAIAVTPVWHKKVNLNFPFGPGIRRRISRFFRPKKWISFVSVLAINWGFRVNEAIDPAQRIARRFLGRVQTQRRARRDARQVARLLAGAMRGETRDDLLIPPLELPALDQLVGLGSVAGKLSASTEYRNPFMKTWKQHHTAFNATWNGGNIVLVIEEIVTAPDIPAVRATLATLAAMKKPPLVRLIPAEPSARDELRTLADEYPSFVFFKDVPLTTETLEADFARWRVDNKLSGVPLRLAITLSAGVTLSAGSGTSLYAQALRAALGVPIRPAQWRVLLDLVSVLSSSA